MSQIPLVSVLREAIVGLIRQDGPDLSSRQLGVLLICSIEKGPHTVRGLAARLQVGKPSITRTLDRLEQFGLVARIPDPTDRRSIHVARTARGADFVHMLRGLLSSAAAEAGAGLPRPTAAAQPRRKPDQERA